MQKLTVKGVTLGGDEGSRTPVQSNLLSKNLLTR